jgi:hypothetical protein
MVTPDKLARRNVTVYGMERGDPDCAQLPSKLKFPKNEKHLPGDKM